MIMAAAVGPVTGISLKSEQFRIDVAVGKPTWRIREIAQGKALGQLVKGYLSPEQCKVITDNFGASLALRARENGVAGQTVGVDLYRATPNEYGTAVLDNRAAVDRLFVGAVPVPSQLRADIQRIMPAGTVVRPAAHNGIDFNHVRAVRWTDAGSHALKCHDDWAQLKDPAQSSLETAKILWPVAFNVYPAVAHLGGELEVYNIAPDQRARTRLGIEWTGYPYPVELLAPFDKLVIKPDPGDLLILSGRFVHGVRGIEGGVRILLNHFGGFIDPTTFVTWS